MILGVMLVSQVMQRTMPLWGREFRSSPALPKRRTVASCPRAGCRMPAARSRLQRLANSDVVFTPEAITDDVWHPRQITCAREEGRQPSPQQTHGDCPIFSS